MDIKTITCPQCGSTDVEMLTEERGKCNMCGSQFRIETALQTEEEETERCIKAIIHPEYTEKDFLRAAWLSLAAEDAPLEIFQENFGEVRKTEHEIYMDSVEADLSYHASIGYDRKEPYIDYEDYYENVPYIAYEKQLNSVTHQYEERQVTKYKKEKRQRQVTKYKTVTDWSATSGTHHASSSAVVENKEFTYLDEYLFLVSSKSAKESSMATPSEDEAKAMQVTEAARKDADREHARAFDDSVERSLGGDQHRDVNWSVARITDCSSWLFKTTEYTATISLGGKTYTKRAFPFGDMKIGGDTVKNTVSPESVAQKKKTELEKNKKDRLLSVDKNAVKKVLVPAVITMLLLLLSVIVSLKIHVTALVVIFFLIAVGAFILNFRLMKKTEEKELQKVTRENNDEERRVESEISDYSANYKRQQREALEQKLSSLGLAPLKTENS